MAIRYDDFEDLVVEVRDGIGHFRVNRPDRMNAFRTQTYAELMEMARRFQVDQDVRVVVASHEGRGFSVGRDLVNRAQGGPDGDLGLPPTDSMFTSTVGLALPNLDKPAIAAINGVCAGAGYAFALSFDLRYLGPQARFVTVFGRRAMSPDCGITYHLPRLVGPAKALELLYTSRDVFAEEALQLGLGNELMEDPLERAMEVAAQLVQGILLPDDLHRSNALKGLLSAIINAAAVVYFAIWGPVEWIPALVMAVAALAGGYYGVGLARRFSAQTLRVVIIVYSVIVAVIIFVR